MTPEKLWALAIDLKAKTLSVRAWLDAAGHSDWRLAPDGEAYQAARRAYLDAIEDIPSPSETEG